MSAPTCDTCDLTGQIARCGPELASCVEVPPSRHAWGDVAVCPTEGCGRQFLFTRRPVGTTEPRQEAGDGAE